MQWEPGHSEIQCENMYFLFLYFFGFKQVFLWKCGIMYFLFLYFFDFKCVFLWQCENIFCFCISLLLNAYFSENSVQCNGNLVILRDNVKTCIFCFCVSLVLNAYFSENVKTCIFCFCISLVSNAYFVENSQLRSTSNHRCSEMGWDGLGLIIQAAEDDLINFEPFFQQILIFEMAQDDLPGIWVNRGTILVVKMSLWVLMLRLEARHSEWWGYQLYIGGIRQFEATNWSNLQFLSCNSTLLITEL